jgi:hypothetical protein
MSARHKLILAVAAVGLLIGAGLFLANPSSAQRSTNHAVEWNVLSGALGQMSSSSYRLNATVGQTMTGWFSGASYEVHAGYWQNFIHRVYLPLVLRSS